MPANSGPLHKPVDGTAPRSQNTSDPGVTAGAAFWAGQRNPTLWSDPAVAAQVCASSRMMLLTTRLMVSAALLVVRTVLMMVPAALMMVPAAVLMMMAHHRRNGPANVTQSHSALQLLGQAGTKCMSDR